MFLASILHPHFTRANVISLVLPPSEVPEEQIRSDRQKIRLGKRKAISDLLNNTREELFSGEFDRWFLCHLFLALR